ncbi:hypothetical protein WJX81_001461 [Elliptochloris bilobata]|uniref:Peptide-methionine (R)-S-oxide reductase n=1 Tax=Elliptochloris bilobata TaxID=381761 RepID=A0AAW1SB13_9CHLO
MAAQQSTNLDKSTPENVWKEVLGTEEYRILRQKGTEPAGTGEYNKMKADGVYRCGGCGAELYTSDTKSDTKFDSGCGWPAFYAEIPGAVDRHVDMTMGMKRTEITCTKCGGHLGHVFENEGFPTPTDARHCVNSRSLKFEAV